MPGRRPIEGTVEPAYYYRNESELKEVFDKLNSGPLIDPRTLAGKPGPLRDVLAVGDFGEGRYYMVQALSCGHRLLRTKKDTHYMAKRARCPHPDCTGRDEWIVKHGRAQHMAASVTSRSNQMSFQAIKATSGATT